MTSSTATAAARRRADAKVNPAEVASKVKFRGKTYTVLAYGEWGKKAARHLRENDYDSWAEAVMAPAEYARWDAEIKTVADTLAFIEAWAESTGEDPGESDASPTS